MEFLLSPEVAAFQESLRKLLAVECPWESLNLPVPEGNAAPLVSGFAEPVYRRLIELGGTLAPLPESAGGLGLGLLAVVAMMEELGSSLAAVPAAETVALGVCPVRRLAMSEAIRAMLDGAHCGDAVCTAALLSHPKGCVASEAGGALTLTGEQLLVPSAAEARYLLVSAELKGEAVLALVDRAATTAAQYRTEAVATLDLRRPFARVVCAGTPAIFLGTVTDVTGDPQIPMFLESRVAFAAELAGIAQRVVAVTVEYVKNRQQFGRPIGSFQTIQHALADMHLTAEQLLALTRFAGWCADADRAQFADAGLAACAFAAKEIPPLVEKAIQLHGGIGFTYEYPLHAFLRRALVTAQLLGGAHENAIALAKRAIG